jgi:hypothetical protein
MACCDVGRRARRARDMLRGVNAVWIVALLGCIYDPDARCGTSRVLREGTCVCKPGTQEANGSCAAAPPERGLGSACSASEHPCTEDDYPGCHILANGDGYCTSVGCGASEDCPEGYFCDSGADPSYCKRVPTGQAAACESSEDCQAFDANYCAMASFGSFCVERDCSPTSCSPGYSCQDFSAIVPGIPKVCSIQLQSAIVTP